MFPSATGGYFDLHNFRNRCWRPAQKTAGITPLRRVYDLRHTFATFALRAGVSTFDLSRYMGTSLAMIDRHYGHLAHDGRVGWTSHTLFDANGDNEKGRLSRQKPEALWRTPNRRPPPYQRQCPMPASVRLCSS